MATELTIENDRSELARFLSRLQLFENFETDELEAISTLARRSAYQTNEYIFSDKDHGQCFYIVERGHLMLYIMGKPVKHFEPGDVFGEVALIDEKLRMGSVRAVDDAVLLRIDAADIFDEQKFDSRSALKLFRIFASMVADYLRSENQTSTPALVEAGESARVEFKSTLRTNLHTDKVDKNIEHAVLKTIAAFLNTDGGTLLVGVADDGEVLGLEQDKFANEDKLLLHLTNLIKQRMGNRFTQFVSADLETVDDTRLLRVDCFPSDSPVYLGHNDSEHFYVRTGPATTELKISEVFTYIQNRFHKPL